MNWICSFITTYKKHTAYLFLNLFVIVSFAQTASLSLSGIVTDSKGNLLSGVNVIIQESTKSAITDESGKFSIPAGAGDILSFSLSGYKTITKELGKNVSELNISMVELDYGDTEQDLVPIAYSNKNKRYLTSAISTTSSEDFAKRKDLNTMINLAGLVNGLIVMSTGWADTGLGTSFYVRGLKTTNSNNSPLILVDDVERTFGQLNVNEIESISVLKDAGALAIYGNRGANGVVLVRTKRGNIKKRDIIINAQVGMSEFQRMPAILNSYDYSRLYVTAQSLDGISSENLKYSDPAILGYKNVVDGVSNADKYKYPNVDFYQDFLKPITKQQQYDLTMTGGTDVAKYFVLLGYMNQEGAYKYGDNSFSRVNFRSNIDVQLNSNLTTSMNMSGRVENQNTPGGHYAYELFGQFASTPSNAYPIFNEDGSLGGTSDFTDDNPYGLMNRSGERNQTNRFFNADIQLKLDLSDLIKGLSWTGKGGIDFYDGVIKQLTGKFATYQLLDDGTYTNNGTINEAKTTNFWYTGKDRQFSLYTSFNYDKNWKNSRLNASTLFYMRELNSSGIAVPYKTVGFATQASYALKNRYILDGTLSYTGSENFARGHRFGLFPAISAGWIISEESFLKDNQALSFLKLRASYGTTGLDKPFSDRFLFRENWGTVTGYSFGVSPTYKDGVDIVRSGNNNLKWETSIKSNLGIDVGFLNNTLSFTIDGFIDNRKDILVKRSASTSSTSGISLPYENFGETKSWGFDSELSFDKQINKSLHLTVKGNIMLTKSKIINIDESEKTYSYQYLTGNSIDQPFGYVSDGFFTQNEITRRSEGNFTAEEIEMGYDVIQNGGNIHAGDIKYVDTNSDKIIDWNDAKAIAGSSVPQLIGGLSLSLKYKDFDFAAQLVGMGKRYIYMPGTYMNNFNGGGNATAYALQAWTPETASTAIYPRLSISNNSNNQFYSDFWFRNGAFIKLKTIEIGYSLPAKLIKGIGISKIRTYVNGYNLFCFDYVNDFDPEDTEAGFSRYPFQRIITIGMNVVF